MSQQRQDRPAQTSTRKEARPDHAREAQQDDVATGPARHRFMGEGFGSERGAPP